MHMADHSSTLDLIRGLRSHPDSPVPSRMARRVIDRHNCTMQQHVLAALGTAARLCVRARG